MEGNSRSGSGGKLAISDLVDKSGDGKLAQQVGELATMSVLGESGAESMEEEAAKEL